MSTTLPGSILFCPSLQTHSAMNMKPSSPSIPSSPRTSNRKTGLPFYLFSVSILLFLLFQFHSLQTSLRGGGGKGPQTADATAKLRRSVTFLPLKDLRYADTPTEGHTWFMSSLNDTGREGEVLHQRFPSEASEGRILCLAGRDPHYGTRNSYGLAWPESLPEGATLAKGLTFVLNTHYDYENIWHGLSATMPFVVWHVMGGCGGPGPRRWVMYHWGEVRTYVAPWLTLLLGATLGGGRPFEIETMDSYGDATRPVCFEEAVVIRHEHSGLSDERKMEAYDLVRCKSRMYCNVSSDAKGFGTIGMTLLIREGGRSFKNESAVIEIFERECRKVEGCRLTVAYARNLSVCEQVKLMSLTDILISPHGAQLTNLILMDRDSSLMELFPKGWLETAGVGQYTFHWLARWSGMRHEGVWRDPDGEQCTFAENERCFWVYKNGRVGHNETYFSEWAGSVLRKRVERMKNGSTNINPVCGCS